MSLFSSELKIQIYFMVYSLQFLWTLNYFLIINFRLQWGVFHHPIIAISTLNQILQTNRKIYLLNSKKCPKEQVNEVEKTAYNKEKYKSQKLPQENTNFNLKEFVSYSFAYKKQILVRDRISGLKICRVKVQLNKSHWLKKHPTLMQSQKEVLLCQWIKKLK